MPGLYSITTREDGELITGAIYTADHQQHVDNQTPQMTDDYSASVVQMQTVTDPFPGGSESLATSLAGELERIRFVLKQILGKAQWYNDAPRNLTKHPACQVKRTAAQSIPNATFTPVNWTVEDLDTDAMFDGAVDASLVTIKTAGIYIVQAQGTFASNATNRRQIRIIINGTTDVELVPLTRSDDFTPVGISTVKKFAVNDTVKVDVFQDSGAALDFGGTAPSTRFSITYLGSET